MMAASTALVVGINLTLRGNTGGSNAGALRLQDMVGMVTFGGGLLFEDNTSDGEGGGMGITSSEGVVVNGPLLCRQNQGFYGGCIYIGSNVGSFSVGDGSTFEGNVATDQGGVIFSSLDSDTDIVIGR